MYIRLALKKIIYHDYVLATQIIWHFYNTNDILDFDGKFDTKNIGHTLFCLEACTPCYILWHEKVIIYFTLITNYSTDF